MATIWRLPGRTPRFHKKQGTGRSRKLGGGFKYFYFHPYLGRWSNLTNIFQLGWNHHLGKIHQTYLPMLQPSRRPENRLKLLCRQFCFFSGSSMAKNGILKNAKKFNGFEAADHPDDPAKLTRSSYMGSLYVSFFIWEVSEKTMDQQEYDNFHQQPTSSCWDYVFRNSMVTRHDSWSIGRTSLDWPTSLNAPKSGGVPFSKGEILRDFQKWLKGKSKLGK